MKAEGEYGKAKTEDGVFRFRKFSVRQTRSAMKVGTDGVLLGAWARIDGCRRVLDIGCGTGLVALMVAQRLAGTAGRGQTPGDLKEAVWGVELDHGAASEARTNARESVYRDMIRIEEGDVREMRGSFDCLVCNPPFFPADVVSPDPGRAMARQAVTLSYGELWTAAGRLSSGGAAFSAIIPYSRLPEFDRLAGEQDFFPVRKCRVRPKREKPVTRALVAYLKGCRETEVGEEELVLYDSGGGRTEEYARLAGEFYL